MKNMLNFLFAYSGIILIAISGFGVWGNYQRVTGHSVDLVLEAKSIKELEESHDEPAEPSWSWEITTIGRIANVFCFGCVSKEVKAINDALKESATAAKRDEIQDQIDESKRKLLDIQKDKEKANQDLLWSIVFFLVSVFFEIWRLHRQRRNR